MSVALKKLPAPLRGKFTLAWSMQAGAEVTPSLGRKNGFLVFGERPGEGTLLRCGVYELQKRIAISQGSGKQSPAADRRIDTVPGERRELVVAVDLDAGEIAMRVGSETVSLTLKQPPRSIAYVGYAEHGVTKKELEEVFQAATDSDVSRSSGRPVVFGDTSTGRHLMVVYEELETNTVYPVPAYEIPRRQRR